VAGIKLLVGPREDAQAKLSPVEDRTAPARRIVVARSQSHSTLPDAIPALRKL
jgi:hypothetical protein